MPNKKISPLHTPRCEKGGISYVSHNALTKMGRNPCINHATASSISDLKMIQLNEIPVLGAFGCIFDSLGANIY